VSTALLFYNNAPAQELEQHEARIMAVLPAANAALSEALRAGVPGTLAIGRPDEDDGCVHFSLSEPEADLTELQRAHYENARVAVEALNEVIRSLDAEGHSAMLTVQGDRSAPLVLLGFSPRYLMNDAAEPGGSG